MSATQSRPRLLRTSALLAVSTLAAAAMFAAAMPSAAARPSVPQHATPTTVVENNLSVVVDPADKIPLRDATITVSGKGFAGGNRTLWVAVCEKDGGAPASMVACLGGAIPDRNGSTAWGIVSSDGAAQAGPATAKFNGPNFTIKLRLAGASDAAADCVANQCSVIVRAADPADTSQNVIVPVAFEKPPAPTVDPKILSVDSDKLTTGASQTIAVTGFAPGEKLAVKLQPTGQDFGPFNTDAGGSALVTFQIPADSVAGAYLATITGVTSKKKLQASFTVTAPPTSSATVSSSAVTSSAAATSSSAAPTSSSAPTSSAPATSTMVSTSASPTEVSTSASPTVHSSTSSAAATLSSTVTATAPASGTSGGLWWLWVVGGLVAVSLIAGGVVLARRSKDSDHGPDDDAPFLAPAVAETPAPPAAAPTASYPAVATDPDRAFLFSHAEPLTPPVAPPTQVLRPPAEGPAMTEPIPVQPESGLPSGLPEQSPRADGGAPTGYFTPSFDSPHEPPPAGRHSSDS